MSTAGALANPGFPDPPAGPARDIPPDLHAEFLFALERGRPRLERVAMRMVRSREDAEDVLQESLLKALRFLPRFRGEARIDTWLHAIVLNTARDWLRSRHERLRMSLETDSENGGETTVLDFLHPGESPEECCSRRELLNLLHEEIDRLDPVYQAPIRLCDLDGRSYREAAGTLEVSGPAIKARLFRGRMLLKGRLSQHVKLRRGARAAEDPARRYRRGEGGMPGEWC